MHKRLLTNESARCCFEIPFDNNASQGFRRMVYASGHQTFHSGPDNGKNNKRGPHDHGVQ